MNECVTVTKLLSTICMMFSNLLVFNDYEPNLHKNSTYSLPWGPSKCVQTCRRWPGRGLPARRTQDWWSACWVSVFLLKCVVSSLWWWIGSSQGRSASSIFHFLKNQGSGNYINQTYSCKVISHQNIHLLFLGFVDLGWYCKII